jgi:hypothetical protein
MEEAPRRIIRLGCRALAFVLAAVMIWCGGATGCAGRNAGARTLAGLGAVAIIGGGGSWAAGENLDPGRHPDGSRALIDAGFFSVAVGLAAVVAAAGWVAASTACHADPDCPEEEQCREIPAPPGGVPYRQCVPR